MAPSSESTTPQVVRVLLDTNVMLDWLLDRKPWADEAEPLWHARDTGRIIAYLPASALTDIYYIARRQVGSAHAIAAIDRSLTLEVVPVNKSTMLHARALPGSDFEDNVIMACAEAERLDFIITRNPDDFEPSPIAVITPTDFVKRL
ncbi:MAG TPA: PIN domain-containing protein [Ktedonobacterales bacterium]|jgi:predicted nucleic acid-binding protein